MCYTLNRLWAFNAITNEGTTSNDIGLDCGINDDDYDEGKIDDLMEGEARLVLNLGNGKSCPVTLEAILIGHEDVVTDVAWKPSWQDCKGSPSLLSSSMDRSILIWRAEVEDEITGEALGVWSPIVRVGIAGGLLGGSVGSTLLGFVGACWYGSRIAGHGHGGAIYFWSNASSGKDALEDEENAHTWESIPGLSGHFGPVEDCCWEATRGSYLLSLSEDQTCRLWASPGDGYNDDGSLAKWREYSRPQVHGYNLKAITCIGVGRDVGGEPLHRFVSGADEKVLRSFDGPESTLLLLKQSGIRCEVDKEKRVDRAYIPSLGLSNNSEASEDVAGFRSVIEDSEKIKLPQERELGVNTLWLESDKLFGHNTEILTLASSTQSFLQDGEGFRNGNKVIVASSCKARDVENASILLWDVDQSKCVNVLKVSDPLNMPYHIFWYFYFLYII